MQIAIDLNTVHAVINPETDRVNVAQLPNGAAVAGIGNVSFIFPSVEDAEAAMFAMLIRLRDLRNRKPGGTGSIPVFIDIKRNGTIS